MSKPLNVCVVEAFYKMRDWIKNHPTFTSLREKKLAEMGVIKRGAVEENLNYYLNQEITCTEIFNKLEEAINKKKLEVITSSSTNTSTVTLRQKDREKLLEEGIKEEEVTRLQNFIQYFFKLYLKSME